MLTERARSRGWPWVLAGAGIVALPALLNGQAFLYFDSAAYMTLPGSLARRLGDLGTLAGTATTDLATSPETRGAVREAQTGRALAYRLFGWASLSTGLGLWPVVVAQALIVSSVMALLWRSGTGRALDWGWLALIAFLTLATPLGLFTGMVMPDVFAGLLVITAGLLAFAWPVLGVGARWFLGGLAAWAMMIHTSHAALGVLLLGALVLAAALGAAVSRRGLAVLALGLIGAIAVEMTIKLAQPRLDGRTLLTRPHVTANLVDRGPGTDYLRRSCPEAGFALCDYVDRLPMLWISFLFSRDPESGVYAVAGPEGRKALAAEHGRFVMAVLADDPLRFAGFALQATLAQLVTLDSADAVVPPQGLENMARMMPSDQLQHLRTTPILLDFNRLTGALDIATRASVLAALALLIAMVVTRQNRDQLRTSPDGPPVLALILVLLFGLLANAAICGILAGVYGRFQARIVWLLPLTAGLLIPLLIRSQRSTSPPPPHALGPTQIKK